MNRRLSPVNLLVVFVEALLISWALMFLAEEFGWHLVREAGGGVTSVTTARSRPSETETGYRLFEAGVGAGATLDIGLRR